MKTHAVVEVRALFQQFGVKLTKAGAECRESVTDSLILSAALTTVPTPGEVSLWGVKVFVR